MKYFKKYVFRNLPKVIISCSNNTPKTLKYMILKEIFPCTFYFNEAVIILTE